MARDHSLSYSFLVATFIRLRTVLSSEYRLLDGRRPAMLAAALYVRYTHLEYSRLGHSWAFHQAILKDVWCLSGRSRLRQSASPAKFPPRTSYSSHGLSESKMIEVVERNLPNLNPIPERGREGERERGRQPDKMAQSITNRVHLPLIKVCLLSILWGGGRYLLPLITISPGPECQISLHPPRSPNQCMRIGCRINRDRRMKGMIG